MTLNLPGRRVFGRPVKPVAGGFVILMLTLAVFNTIDAGVLGATVLGHVTGALAGVSAVTLLAGWWGSWQRVAEAGLLAAFAAYGLRGLFVLFTQGPWVQAVWLSLGAAVIAWGSFVLETMDERGAA